MSDGAASVTWSSWGLFPAPASSNLTDWKFTARALTLLSAVFTDDKRCLDQGALYHFRSEIAALQNARLMRSALAGRCGCPGAGEVTQHVTTKVGDAILNVIECTDLALRLDRLGKCRRLVFDLRRPFQPTVDRFYDLLDALADGSAGTDERSYVASILALQPHCRQRGFETRGLLT